jgi:hypothetical protein
VSLLFGLDFHPKQAWEFDLRVRNPASKESATDVWTSVDETDEPAILKISIY